MNSSTGRPGGRQGAKIKKTLLGLDTFGTMPQVNMLDLMPEHSGESVFTLHESQQACTHEDVATGSANAFTNESCGT
jgi:hypothetical protein